MSTRYLPTTKCWPSAARMTAGHRVGFTLIELLVAITVTLILLLIAAQMVTEAIDTTVRGTGLGEITTHSQAIESNLRRDVRNISRDGFLVIRMGNRQGRLDDNDPLQTVAVDQMFFFANSNFSTSNPQVGFRGSSPIARVWYGHLDSPAFSDDRIRNWSLGRQNLQLIMQPPLAAEASGQRASSLLDPLVAAGRADIVQTFPALLRQQILAGGVPFGTQRDRMLERSQRIAGSSWALPADFMQIHALIANNCSSFRIQFAGDYSGDGGIDRLPNGSVRWYGLQRAGGVVTTGNPQIDAGASANSWDAVFGYDHRATPWPRLIRITYTLHDIQDRWEGVEFEIVAELGDGRLP